VRDLGTLGDVVAALRGGDDAEGFVQTGGEERKLRVRHLVVGAGDVPNFPAAGGDEQFLIGQGENAAGFEDDVIRNRNGRAFPI
jgi:hypothetical protein